MSSNLNYIQDRTICPSICIPRVFKHITVPFIIDIFQEKLYRIFVQLVHLNLKYLL